MKTHIKGDKKLPLADGQIYDITIQMTLATWHVMNYEPLSTISVNHFTKKHLLFEKHLRFKPSPKSTHRPSQTKETPLHEMVDENAILYLKLDTTTLRI